MSLFCDFGYDGDYEWSWHAPQERLERRVRARR